MIRMDMSTDQKELISYPSVLSYISVVALWFYFSIRLGSYSLKNSVITFGIIH